MQITNADIAHVGPGTPGGDWLRRYWHAVGTTKELFDIPQAVRVLGEDLVLFRDLTGKLGLLGQACAHRGASLEYGDIEERGIRCCYHGWLYDTEGQCIDMPCETPAGSMMDPANVSSSLPNRRTASFATRSDRCRTRCMNRAG
ncbi:MAG: Rieske 2Fe-2S domain-containing protein [Proteobacteria bacterium]|nr:Rieske 2Fe-2S domain-containing protein [Pseudomonadota bacterium]